MRRALLAVAVLAVVGSAVGVARATQPQQQQQQMPPAPTEDRVGFPEGYTEWEVYYTFDRADNKQVRIIYANEAAAAAPFDGPFPYGSILVMETWRAKLDDQMNPILDETGRYQKDSLTGIFVMRKEPGFGEAYGPNRTGEWEYISFRPDRSYLNEPARTGGCAVCHFDTRGDRDWTYRTELHFNQSNPGANPQGLVQAYTFLPDTITVPAGTTVTWINNDVVPHTVTAGDGSWDSGKMLYGFSFSQRFDTPGTFQFNCSIHPVMTGQVVVE
ncbi:MAG: cytochrome P460 family protein [Dehalococcoidia bacterium]